MSEAQVGFLYDIAATISKSPNNVNNTLLKSYYLMHCKDITRGYGLPDKHFSSSIRCPNCCIEWKSNMEIKMQPIKLSTRQKQRLKSKKVTHNKKEYIRRKKNLLISNKLEQICTFCRHSTVTTVIKPQKQLPAPVTETQVSITEANHRQTNNTKITKQENTKPEMNRKAMTNVYSSAFDIFSIQNKNNTLASTIKEKPKVINNNKKKKDKFAGLCQKAVLASAKLKEQKNNSNPLNLFLKPST